MTKGTSSRKITIEFCIAHSGGHSTAHFETKITSLTQFLLNYCKFHDLKHASGKMKL